MEFGGFGSSPSSPSIGHGHRSSREDDVGNGEDDSHDEGADCANALDHESAEFGDDLLTGDFLDDCCGRTECQHVPRVWESRLAYS